MAATRRLRHVVDEFGDDSFVASPNPNARRSNAQLAGLDDEHDELDVGRMTVVRPRLTAHAISEGDAFGLSSKKERLDLKRRASSGSQPTQSPPHSPSPQLHPSSPPAVAPSLSVSHVRDVSSVAASSATKPPEASCCWMLVCLPGGATTTPETVWRSDAHPDGTFEGLSEKQRRELQQHLRAMLRQLHQKQSASLESFRSSASGGCSSERSSTNTVTTVEDDSDEESEDDVSESDSSDEDWNTPPRRKRTAAPSNKKKNPPRTNNATPPPPSASTSHATLTIAQLKELLRANQLPVTGTKPILLARYEEFLKRQSSSSRASATPPPARGTRETTPHAERATTPKKENALLSSPRVTTEGEETEPFVGDVEQTQRLSHRSSRQSPLAQGIAQSEGATGTPSSNGRLSRKRPRSTSTPVLQRSATRHVEEDEQDPSSPAARGRREAAEVEEPPQRSSLLSMVRHTVGTFLSSIRSSASPQAKRHSV